MYLEHFGLREAPFRITPHTEFFFSGANRGATLEALIYAITHDEGIVKVSGEVGSGKTMLCRMLLERLPANVETVYLANPSLSCDEIFQAIAEELHAPLPEGRSHYSLRALQQRLIEIHTSGRQVVVMVDEAHAMPAETLEEIRLLSNLETSRHKLVHIVLFGQRELDEHLRQTNMRPLKERITHNFALEPLRSSDIANYLSFRLRAAGYHGPSLFTPSAIERISRASEGLTRRINILADKALLSAFSENRQLIDDRQVQAAINDAQFNPIADHPTRPARWIVGAALLVLIAGLAYLAANRSTPGVAVAATDPPAIRAEIAPPTAETPPTDPADPADSSPPAEPTAASPPPAPTSSAATAAAPSSPDLLAERLTASQDWLKTVPDTHYFIQLFNADANRAREVENFLESSALDAGELRVYRSALSGRDRFGVIYGDYPSPDAANADLARVARISRVSRPYIRSVSKLR
ncbi:MAG: Sporulation domain protein [Proteobacteria bacterium]|nr:Sporulation domain protein [Pseudomonadota bacterium]